MEKIPPQVYDSLATDFLETGATAIQGTAQTTFVSHVILNVLFSGGLWLLWSIFNSLQIIAYLPLINVPVPGIAQDLF